MMPDREKYLIRLGLVAGVILGLILGLDLMGLIWLLS